MKLERDSLCARGILPLRLYLSLSISVFLFLSIDEEALLLLAIL